ncbi:MAG: radical SAM protein [Armatimonadetes bacterium]|nr:radical SAM protein [Armatimonadota bacterium]
MRVASLISALVTRRTPYYVHFGVTHRCNLTCRMCGIWKMGDKRSEVSPDQIRQIARNLRDLGTGVVSLGGGEPLLRDDLPQIIRTFFDQGIEVRMLTNGYTRTSTSAYNQKFLDEIVATGLKHVSISLDTMDSARFADICQKDDVWNTAVETIGRFSRVIAKRGGMGNINCVVSRANLQELPRMVDLAERLGFWISFIPLEVHEYAGKIIEKERADDMFFAPPDFPELEEMYGRLIEMKRQGRRIFSSTPFLEKSLKYLKGGGADWTCLAGSLYFSISPEGRFSVCHKYQGTGGSQRDVLAYAEDFPARFRDAAFQAECAATSRPCKACLRPCWTEVALTFTHPRSFWEMVACQMPHGRPAVIPTAEELTGQPLEPDASAASQPVVEAAS